MKIDKKIITNLREEYGDAFYLLDSEQFQKNFIELRDTFRSIYPNFNRQRHTVPVISGKGVRTHTSTGSPSSAIVCGI